MTSDSRGSARIGTSGWHYDHWIGPFFPPETDEENMLPFYCKRFQSVEINNSFYQLPENGTLNKWKKTVPDDFQFAIKASRYITHMKKLKDPKESTKKFFDAAETLGEKCGPVLFQLPPKFSYNGERLANFLDALPDGYRYAFEFRDWSWHNKEALQMLRDKEAAFCIFDLDGDTTKKEVTAGFVYIRLHGPDSAYQGSYNPQKLAGWAGAITAWLKKGYDVYCFFDNDQDGYAAQNALRLYSMIK